MQDMCKGQFQVTNNDFFLEMSISNFFPLTFLECLGIVCQNPYNGIDSG